MKIWGNILVWELLVTVSAWVTRSECPKGVKDGARTQGSEDPLTCGIFILSIHSFS